MRFDPGSELISPNLDGCLRFSTDFDFFDGCLSDDRQWLFQIMNDLAKWIGNSLDLESFVIQ